MQTVAWIIAIAIAVVIIYFAFIKQYPSETSSNAQQPPAPQAGPNKPNAP